ncbi:hypothetical protein OF001_U40230 [Pseudomonas sp. OF001]|nr:hypothetical protein OF001_U40230 [Pseudomonas sp. OF001]
MSRKPSIFNGLLASVRKGYRCYSFFCPPLYLGWTLRLWGWRFRSAPFPCYAPCYAKACQHPARSAAGLDVDGAGTRNRTRDLLITSQLLYQLSYTGKNGSGL